MKNIHVSGLLLIVIIGCVLLLVPITKNWNYWKLDPYLAAACWGFFICILFEIIGNHIKIIRTFVVPLSLLFIFPSISILNFTRIKKKRNRRIEIHSVNKKLAQPAGYYRVAKSVQCLQDATDSQSYKLSKVANNLNKKISKVTFYTCIIRPPPGIAYHNV